MSERDPYIVPGLVRGLAALNAFNPQTPELSLSELSRVLGVTRSAAFRTVHTLVSEGYLLQVPNSQRYRLGPQVLGLSDGYLIRRELLEITQPLLEALRDEIDWSAHLGVLDRQYVLYLIRIPASDGLSALVHVGSRLPAAQTAMGRLLLSRKTEREVRYLLADRSDLEIEQTLRTCARDRNAGTVIHEGQFESGLTSIAAPILDKSGTVIAAISATKFSGQVSDSIKQSLLKAARGVSKGLGAD